MSKSLVIAEKPSVARDIARVLHCNQKVDNVLEGKDYVITWALGHLVTLADPEEYVKEWKQWSMDVLPMEPKNWKLVVIPKTRRQFVTVKKQLYRKDIDTVIIATDAGREGELVARWILDKAGCHKKIKRLWISSVTDRAIREGFAHLKEGQQYENLYMAAYARAKADWLVGINGTRALTCKHNAQLSCGRVQTPTLAMLEKREEMIRRFRSQSYYELKVMAEGISFSWRDAKTNQTRCFDKEKMNFVEEKIKGKSVVLRSIDKKTKKAVPPQLFDLTELQREANRLFDMSAKETLNIMQSLYETHKVLTYPRTDSRYISEDIVDTLKDRLEACKVGPYRSLAGKILRRPISCSKQVVDGTKVTDHHAILPTEQFVDLAKMSNGERKIYDLVIRRFMAALLPASVYDVTTIEGEVEGEKFVAKGEILKEAGWKEAYERGETKDIHLPALTKGERLKIQSIRLEHKKTLPPPRFTEATLLSAMENPSAYLETKNQQAAKLLGETGGLGTVATRADIIDKLFDTYLMEKKGQELFLTSKGKQLLQLVPEDLKQPELTASLEGKLQKIANGTLKEELFMKEIVAYADEVVEDIKKGKGTYHHDNLTNKTCPRCGKKMLDVQGKNSRRLVCQDRECGYRETVSQKTNARCPVCHKKMELYGKGQEQTFVCTCGFKEKMEAFQARRKKEGKDVSKKDVQRYMKQQQKEAKTPINNAFQEAFANLNLDTLK